MPAEIGSVTEPQTIQNQGKLGAAGPVQEGGTSEIRKQVTVSNTYNDEDIKNIIKDFEKLTDKEIVGPMPEEVKLFEKDKYSTHDWTPVQFAVYNKNLRAVRYYIEGKLVNPRTSTRRRESKEDDNRYDRDVFPIVLAINNKDEAMFEYIWSMNELWDYEHLKIVLQVLFSRTIWPKGVEILLGCEASQDQYNVLPYSQRKQFIIELFYRYLFKTDDNIKDLIRER